MATDFHTTMSNPEDVVKLIKKYGLAIIPSYKHDHCISIKDKIVDSLRSADNKYDFGKAIRYWSMPGYLSPLFIDDNIKKVADVYFGQARYALHHEIFLTNEFKAKGYVKRRLLTFFGINLFNLAIVEIIQVFLIESQHTSTLVALIIGMIWYVIFGFVMNQCLAFRKINVQEQKHDA